MPWGVPSDCLLDVCSIRALNFQFCCMELLNLRSSTSISNIEYDKFRNHYNI